MTKKAKVVEFIEHHVDLYHALYLCLERTITSLLSS